MTVEAEAGDAEMSIGTGVRLVITGLGLAGPPLTLLKRMSDKEVAETPVVVGLVILMLAGFGSLALLVGVMAIIWQGVGI